MRRVIVAGLTGLFLLSAAAMTGCGSDKKADVPDKMMELPKQGPVPAGGAPATGGSSAQ
jgi:hypothetical protein